MPNYIEEEQGGKGALAIIIVIVILLLIGGIYAVNTQKDTELSQTSSSTDQLASPEAALSSSTNLDDINRDLESLNTETSQTELDQLEKEVRGL